MALTQRHLAATLLCTTALVAALATALPLAAQESDETLYLGQIIIGYTADGTPIFAGENATHLDEDALRGAASAADIDTALRQQTSVFTQKDPGNPGLAVNIRGFEGSGRVAMSIDGVPQAYRLTGHAAQGFTYVDENLLAGIDITRGAVTTTGGSGIAGTADFRTIEADDVVAEGKTQGGLVRLSYGDNGETASGMGAAALKTERFDLLFALSRHSGDDYEDGAGTTVANTYEDISSGLLKLGYNISDSQRISLSLMRYESDFYATSYFQELSNNTARLSYHYDPGNALVDLRVNAYSNETETEFVAGTGSYVGRTMSTRTTGLNATNLSQLSLGGWSLTSANGVDLSQDRLGGTRGGVNPTGGKALRASLFSENVFVNGKWEVTAGLRANRYSLDGTASRGEIDIDNSSLDPKLTLAYQAADWLQPYLTVSKTMRSPTLQETMLGGSHPGGGVGMIANPELEPEESRGYELGFNLARENLFAEGDKLTGRVNYYRMDVENYVVAGFGFTNAFGDTGAAFVNVPGTSRTSGLEVELNYRHRRFDLGLSYTKNDSDMPSQMPGLGAGQYLPDSTLALRAAGHFLQDRLTLGAQYNYVSGGLYTDTYTTTPYQKDTSYELVDLFASYALSDTAELYAKVTNVFDTDYAPWLSAASTEKGRGRTVFVGTTLRF